MLPPTLIYRAAAIRDAAGHCARPGMVVVRAGRILTAGPIAALDDERYENPHHHDLGDRLILPGMVNAHCHLDLSALGPQPYGGSFVAWVRGIQGERSTEVAKTRKIVERAAAASHTAGVIAVGDIAAAETHKATRAALEQSSLEGISFEEQMGSAALEACRETEAEPSRGRHGMRHGLQPHAPYSTAPPIYRAAAERSARCGTPVATHLAELPEEIEFVRHGRGPFRELLISLDRWDHGFASHYGHGKHPVDWLAPALGIGRWLLAHCNLLEDAHLPLLAACGASVAYCPVASDYFGHRAHRYRDLLAAGVNVCLGTDSIICQSTSESQPLGILPQMRHVHRRDGTDPMVLLAMATTRGAAALQLPVGTATLQPGARADLYAVRIDPDDPTDPLIQALLADGPLERV